MARSAYSSTLFIQNAQNACIIIYTVERYMSGSGLQLLVIVSLWLELYTSVYSVCYKECRSNTDRLEGRTM